MSLKANVRMSKDQTRIRINNLIRFRIELPVHISVYVEATCSKVGLINFTGML